MLAEITSTYFSFGFRGVVMVNLRRLFLQTIIYRFFMVWIVACFSHGVFSANVMDVEVPDGEIADLGDVYQEDSGFNKKLGGTLVLPDGKSSTGPANVLEGTLVSNGPLSGTLTVRAGATYRSSTTAEDIYNGGNIETSTLDSLVASSLRVSNFVQTSVVDSSLSIKIFPDLTCDYLEVDAATLTGNLQVYVGPGAYDEGGARFSIIRGGPVSGSFVSLINVLHANVALSYEEDASNFYLIVRGNVPYVPPTPTAYNVGLRLNETQRHDTIMIGGTGGFEGFTVPEAWCRVLFINFMQTGTSPEQNTNLTNGYTGSGALPYLPTHIEEIWFTGDPTGYDVLVAGGAQFALPTPGTNTRIRFAFTRSPRNPLTWFQGGLPAGCQLVVQPGSADPFIDTVLPLEGGRIIIGAPVTLQPGVAALLDGSQLCPIQRYPNMLADDISANALIRLTEATRFRWGVFGLSIRGAFPAIFDRTSNLFEPHADSADAGYVVDPYSTLTIYQRPGYTLPEVESYLAPGGTSNIVSSTDLAKSERALPEIKPPLDEWS